MYLIIGILLIIGTMICGANSAYSFESTVSKEITPEPVDLIIAKGKVTGDFQRRPVSEILSILQTLSPFEISAKEELLAYPISGNLDKASLIDVIENILRPFNFITIRGDKDKIQRLIILSLSEDFQNTFPATASAPSQTEDKPVKYEKNKGLIMLDQLDLTPEQRRAFEVADQNIGPSPEEVELFYPIEKPVWDGQRKGSLAGSQATGPDLEEMDLFYPLEEPVWDGQRKGPLPTDPKNGDYPQ